MSLQVVSTDSSATYTDVALLSVLKTHYCIP